MEGGEDLVHGFADGAPCCRRSRRISPFWGIGGRHQTYYSQGPARLFSKGVVLDRKSSELLGSHGLRCRPGWTAGCRTRRLSCSRLRVSRRCQRRQERGSRLLVCAGVALSPRVPRPGRPLDLALHRLRLPVARHGGGKRAVRVPPLQPQSLSDTEPGASLSPARPAACLPRRSRHRDLPRPARGGSPSSASPPILSATLGRRGFGGTLRNSIQ